MSSYRVYPAALACLLAASTTTSEANVLRLVCKGTFHAWEQNVPEANVPELNLEIDLSKYLVKGFGTPVRELDIRRVDDDQISFGANYRVPADAQEREAFGTISRTTGRAQLHWKRKNQPNQWLGFFDLNCARAQKLF